MRRALRFLRSPRTGVALVLAVAAYSVLGTLLPQSSEGRVAIETWTAAHPTAGAIAAPLGMFDAYSTPLFLVLLALLGASTSACAWSRSARALRMWRASGHVGDSVLARLKNSATIDVSIPAGERRPLQSAAGALEKMGLRAKIGPQLVEASSGRFGLLGSPVFHWTLVALILLVAAGQLTRSEGMIGIPVGESRVDTARSYIFLDQGLLGFGQSGLTLTVRNIQPHVVIGGVDRDASPEVRLALPDGTVLREQLVYPNHPLRYGTIMVHRNSLGFSVPATLTAPDGSVAATQELLFDPVTDKPEVAPLGLSFSGLPSGSIDVTLTLLPRRGAQGGIVMEPASSTRMRVAGPVGSTVEVSAPGVYRLPGGYLLHFGSVNNYARLTVVRDWSVYGIYALLILALVFSTVAMTVPYRLVWLLLVEDGGQRSIHGVTMHSGRNPAFADEVRAVVSRALEAAE